MSVTSTGLRPGRLFERTIERVSELAGGDWSPSTISRWETGDRRIRPSGLRLLLEIHEVRGEQRDVLLTSLIRLMTRVRR